MIITPDEYYDMGFAAEDDAVLDSALKRAEYTLAALTEGRIYAAVNAGGTAAQYVKQAAGFQTQKLVRENQRISSGASTERVAIGDFSYSSESCSDGDIQYSVELSRRTMAALRAAGCLYGGREARG